VRGNVLFVALCAGVLTGSVATAADCRLDGRAYPPNVMICQGGLAQVCVNGNWQNNDGLRCDQPTGTLLGPRRPFSERNDESIPDEVVEQYPGLLRR
jgi:hypothetical protein